MKFAKYLQEEAVPEWRKAYIDYKQGKKLLKAIESALDEIEAAEALKLGRIAMHVPGGASDSEPFPHAHLHQPAPYDPPASTPTIDENTDTNRADDSTPRTPIMTRPRGNSRNNYSTIVIAPPMNLPRSLSYQVLGPSLIINEDDQSGDMTLEGHDDGSGLGPASPPRTQQRHTTYSMNSATAASSGSKSPTGTFVEQPQELQGPPPIQRVQPQRSGSSFSHLSQSAMTQSSQLLKNLSRRFTIIYPPELSNARARSIQVDESSFDSVLGQLMPEERIFFQFLHSQLEMVNKFYQEKELEAVTKLRVIKQQLYVANEWKRRYDEKTAKARAENGWYVTDWNKVRNGLDNFMRADPNLTADVTIGPYSRETTKNTLHPLSATTAAHGGSLSSLDPEHGLYRRRGAHENNQNVKLGANDLAYQKQLILEDKENRKEHLNHKVARTRIKAALYEFYRSLEMIKNYKVLNHTGFAKILKKFDKTAGWKASKGYMNSNLKPAYFMTSPMIEGLIKETEDVFIESFEKGHRRRGMAKLRIPDSKNQTHHLVSTRIGLYLGLMMPLMFQALQAAFSDEMPAEIPYFDSLLLVYAGLFLTFMFACLFGINMYAWTKSRINYKFIFEFDPRDNLDFHEYFELPIFLMLLLTLALYLDFGNKLTQHVATAYWPLILIAITFFILFCPLPIVHFSARRWFLSSIGRIIASGYYRVEFRDFFLADEMNSLSYSIEQFEFALCAYSRQWSDLGHTCQTSHMWITPFVTGLPAWFRFLQCLRRYRDTLEWFPHLLNAGKYTSSLVNLFIYFSYRHYGGQTLKVAYILMATITGVYTFMWDVYMDWGLFRFGKHGGGAYGHPFLRQELVYSRTWVYYLAIVLDLLGRFSWIVRFMPLNINVYILSFGLAFIEVLRRWQWNFFRLENEHLNNCGQFRAIKDIPLPFHIRVEGETDDDENDDDDDENRHSREESEEDDVRSMDRREYDRASNHSDNTTSQEMISSDPAQGHYQPLKNPGMTRSDSQSSILMAENSSGYGLSNLSRASDSRYTVHSNGSSSSRLRDRGVGHRYSSSQVYIHPRSDSEIGGRPFGRARSSSFVEVAVAEAGFKNPRRDVLESETRPKNKFYDRRDFDSKIIDNDSPLWQPGSRGRSMVVGSVSMQGLQTFGEGGGADRNVLRGRRSQSQVIQSRRKQSIGTRMRSSIFGKDRSDSDEDDYDDEDDETE
ncbi:hypothetical protein BGZ93_000422 [Podila epicladia]|nr:hypothetical protein BGZ92_005065 [Podila epicladia]KAG0098344.1 hypothetical protein BGZ93_000422 [Podila epicladia]